MNGPPKKVEAPKGPNVETNGHHAITVNHSRVAHGMAYDALAAQRRRREAAVRLPGENPDPLYPRRRYHRPTTGFRAAGFQQGYSAALRWILREHSSQVDETLRAKLAAIVKRSGL